MDCLVLTILSQNTNDKLRDQAYQQLVRMFPSWDRVLEAPTEEIARTIAKAGLSNQKSSAVKRLLMWSKQWDHDLSWMCEAEPQEAYETLTAIKGIGDKTAKVCLLFCCHMPFFPVDTHISRVSKRLGIAKPNWDRQKISQRFQEMFPPQSFYHLHINLIELGRRVCKPRKPLCNQCPVESVCLKRGI